jgi:hypothetical protein
MTFSWVGLPEIVLVLGLLGFALWKKDWIRIVLSLCIIIWGAFALSYDVKIAAPLIAGGAILVFMGIFNVMQGQRRD